MADATPQRSARIEAVMGIIAGVVLALFAWIGTGAPGTFLMSHLSAKQAAVATPAPKQAAVATPQKVPIVQQAIAAVSALLPAGTVTPPPGADCLAPASTIARIGFDPYAILAQKRPDVLQFYANNGWNPQVQCLTIYDDWTAHGAGGSASTTPAAYVKVQGWAPTAPAATPAPPTDCMAPAAEVARLGFDPYRILALNRPDVLNLYKLNGWDLNTQCIKLFDNWLQHPDGGPTVTAAAFVVAKGWAKAPVAFVVPIPTIVASPTAVATSVPPTVVATPVPPAALATLLPPADCVAPASTIASVGFDPYQLLALHRPDVLNLYKLNGWDPATQCVKLFDDWLQHPDGGPSSTAAAFVVDKGWAEGRTASGVSTYTVQSGDTLFVIAQRLHVSLLALQQANGIQNPDAIQAGQVLRLPSAPPTP